MPAPKGNQFYKLISNPGRKKEYETAAQLGKVAIKYFKYIEANPMPIERILSGVSTETTIIPQKGRGKAQKHTVTTAPYQRVTEYKRIPFTLEGLCNYLEITVQTFHNYQAREAFFDVCTGIRQIIDQDQFVLGVLNLANAAIIARKLGLTDKRDITTGGEKLNRVTIFEIPNNHRDGKVSEPKGD